MKLDDLKEMHIPYLAPIEVESDKECIPPQVGKYLGYFRETEGNTLTQSKYSERLPPVNRRGGMIAAHSINKP